MYKAVQVLVILGFKGTPEYKERPEFKVSLVTQEAHRATLVSKDRPELLAVLLGRPEFKVLRVSKAKLGFRESRAIPGFKGKPVYRETPESKVLLVSKVSSG